MHAYTHEDIYMPLLPVPHFLALLSGMGGAGTVRWREWKWLTEHPLDQHECLHEKGDVLRRAQLCL